MNPTTSEDRRSEISPVDYAGGWAGGRFCGTIARATTSNATPRAPPRNNEAHLARMNSKGPEFALTSSKTTDRYFNLTEQENSSINICLAGCLSVAWLSPGARGG